MSTESGEVAEEQLSVEDRLHAAETRIEGLDRDSTQLTWAIAGTAALALILVLVTSIWPDSEAAPTDRDATLDQLLSAGVHCYDSAAERAAARQRALAAIDRINWERDHEVPSDYALGSPGSALRVVPSMRENPLGQESWDATRCFKIS